MIKYFFRHLLISALYFLLCSMAWLSYYVIDSHVGGYAQYTMLVIYTLILIGMIFKSHKILTENYEKKKVSMIIKSHNYEETKVSMKNAYTVGTIFLALLYALFSDEIINIVSVVVGGEGYTYIVISTLVTYLLMLMAVYFSNFESPIEQNY